MEKGPQRQEPGQEVVTKTVFERARDGIHTTREFLRKENFAKKREVVATIAGLYEKVYPVNVIDDQGNLEVSSDHLKNGGSLLLL